MLSLFFLEYIFKHTLHSKGFSPECINSCVLRCPFVTNYFPHPDAEQTKGLSPV